MAAPTTAPAANYHNPTLGLVGAGLGVLGSLGAFGGGGTVTNPYADQGNTDFGRAEENYGVETSAGTGLVHAGQNTLADFNGFAPQADQATQDELSYLRTNPYTDTYDQAQLSRSTGGAMQGFAAAKAALASDLGRRGLASPGGASSALSGGDAAIDAAAAGTLANNQNSIALDAITQRGRNLAQANQIAAQHASMLFNEGAGASEAGSNILGGAAAGYDNTGNDWLHEGEQQINDTQNSNSAASSSWGGLAGIGMKVAGLGL